jgi:hypothetical protein
MNRKHILFYTRDVALIAKWVSGEAEKVSCILTHFNSTSVTHPFEAYFDLNFLSALYNSLKTDPNVNVKEITLKLDNWTNKIVDYIRKKKQYLQCIKTRLSTDRKQVSSILSYLASVKAHIDTMSDASDRFIKWKAEKVNIIAITTNKCRSMMSEIEVINLKISPAEESIEALERNLLQAIPPIAAAG